MRLLIFVLCLPAFIDAQNSKKGFNGNPAVVPISEMPEKDFKRGDLPFMVALLDNRNESKPFFCAGTLITTRHVLTAAHCIVPKVKKAPYANLTAEDVLAVFGAFDLSNDHELNRVELVPESIKIHDNWNITWDRHDGDIAILTFKEDIPQSKFVKRVSKIYTTDHAEQPAADGYVFGWGPDENKTIPKIFVVPIRTNEDCFLTLSKTVTISSLNTFCSSWPNATGACYGDFGSGIFLKKDGSYIFKGIGSSSLKKSSCGDSRFMIYSNLVKYFKWFDDQTNFSKQAAVVEEKKEEGPVGTTCADLSDYTPLEQRDKEIIHEEFPHMAILTNKYDERINNCEGVLISDKFVLTTAVCAEQQIRYAILGKRIGDRVVEDSVRIAVKKRMAHPDYNSRYLNDDIALLELRDRVNFNENIKPACLYRDATNDQRNLFAIGVTNFDVPYKNRETKIRAINIMEEKPNQHCLESEHPPGSILCAKEFSVNRNCKSSGSFIGTTDGKRFVVHGILSSSLSSKICDINGKIYTRVASYIKWIESHVSNTQTADTSTVKKGGNHQEDMFYSKAII